MEGTAVMRKQTKRFIDENPSVITFERNARITDGMGGWLPGDPIPVEPQTVRVVEQVSAQAVERRTSAGEMTSPEFKVVAEWDADIQMNDTMLWNGLTLEVVWIILMPYEKTCDMAVR